MTDFALQWAGPLGMSYKPTTYAAWYKPTENQEKSDPHILEILIQDFPPSHSFVLPRQMSLYLLWCQQRSL